MEKKLKKLQARILISFIIFISAIFLPLINIRFEVLQITLFFIAYIIVGFDVIKKAILNILKGQILDEHFLMTLATVAAFVTKEYPEGVMVMLLYQLGELFQKYAVGKSRKSIKNLMDINPEYANVEEDGKIIKKVPEEVKVGDIIVIKPGEKVPLDGIVVEGESTLDTAALTGESLPRRIKVGEEICNGCINVSSVLKIKVLKLFRESTVSKILELVENASSRKAKAENFINRFEKYYTPIVVIIAFLLAFVPPLVIEGAVLTDYIHRACSFLVISCPCALVISIPLGFFGGIGGASKLGILIKGSNYLEILSKTKTIVFDKTGTLTKGSFEISKVNVENQKENIHQISKEEMIEIAALAEGYSNHPIANSIKKFYGKELDTSRIKKIEEVSGHGIIAEIDERKVCIGNAKLMKKMNIEGILYEEKVGTIIYIAVNDKYVGNIIVTDKIKDEVTDAIAKLKTKDNVENIVMLTGDNQTIAKQVAEELKIENVYSELLPGDKIEKVETLIENKKKNTSVVFVGDGINDAPVLTRADLGIAMGGLGTDAAIEAADIVIMDDNIAEISTAISLSKRTLNIVKQNIVFALTIKLIVLILGALGMANMWEAVFADVGVSIIAIINSMRAMDIRKYKH